MFSIIEMIFHYVFNNHHNNRQCLVRHMHTVYDSPSKQFGKINLRLSPVIVNYCGLGPAPHSERIPLSE